MFQDVLLLVEQLENRERTIEKEAEDRRTETVAIHDRRSIWAAMVAS